MSLIQGLDMDGINEQFPFLQLLEVSYSSIECVGSRHSRVPQRSALAILKEHEEYLNVDVIEVEFALYQEHRQ